MIKVKHLQSDEIYVFTPSEFFLYLVGLCNAGRHPLLHITSGIKPTDNYLEASYNVIIEFRN